jgi:SAM-dependent methyltransferase
MDNPVFLFPQCSHALIPQAHAAANDLELARDIKAFWDSMFQLFQRKTEEVTAADANDADADSLYRQVRLVLDGCAEVNQVHHRRGEFQDRLWASVLTAIEDDRSRLEAVYHRHQTGPGGLELDPDLEFPRHQLKTHIHRMPGGYLQDPHSDSFETGVLYDHGVFLYGRGWFGPLNDALGQTIIHHVLAQHYPHFQPQKILDMGCSVGHSTLPYASAYPQAQVWGIDLGASLLRYATARARALDQTLYFAQQNAENTHFADQSFDLVVSHILLHEIPGVARQRVFAESYRLLKPGGMMVHLESKLFLKPPTLVARYFRDTEVWANSEPYLASSEFTDFPTYALEAGFAPEAFQIHEVPGYYTAQLGSASAGWVALCGVKN